MIYLTNANKRVVESQLKQISVDPPELLQFV